jgi:hypothetical protein
MSKSRPVKILAAVAAVAVLAVVAFVAFGSSSNSTVDPVAEAATQSTATAGEKMLLTIKLSSPTLPGAISGSGNGTFDQRSRSGTLSLAMALPKSPAITQALGGNTLKINEILHGSTIYMQLPSVLMKLLSGGQSKPWLSLNVAKLAGVPGLSSIGGNPVSSNPAALLGYLRAAGSNVTTVGHDVVDGFGTTHYRADLTASQAANRLPASSQQAFKALLQQAHLSQIPIDVWIDSKHLVRRIGLNLQASQGGQAVNEAVTIDIPEYGPQPQPTIPPASEVQAVTLPAAAP